LSLSTIGLLQYIAPTGQLALGVLLWSEPFTSVNVVAFITIWVALGLYTVDIMRTQALARGKPKTMRS
jgi:chloramphenicol-sensitive protein RarD